MIVEDHGVVAEGLAALINHQDDMKVVGKAGSVAECVPAAAELDRTWCCSTSGCRTALAPKLPRPSVRFAPRQS